MVEYWVLAEPWAGSYPSYLLLRRRRPQGIVPVVSAVPPSTMCDSFCTRFESLTGKAHRQLRNDRVGDGKPTMILYSISNYRERP